jgi:hypothetical protein
MTARKLTLGCLCLTIAIGATGCFSTDPRTSNQGGGNLLTAGAKVAGERVYSLTPDEIQILADEVSARSSNFNLSVTDEQAADAAQFLKTHGVRSLAELEAIINQYRQDPGSIDIPDSVLDLFDAGAFRVAP